ncbi:alpha/beta fold hydrolase [Streptomyces scopuliridis]|uniref:alpha/beta fold hydrolase n=1 Tax=Streptomyces scopuliridis TaxID=452529 RepID=UPI0036AFCE24
MSPERPDAVDAPRGAERTVRHRRPTEGPRALLLHGLANSPSVWEPLAGSDAGGTDLWTAELPWSGGQPPDWAYGPDAGWAIADALDQVPGGVGMVVAHSFSAVLLLNLLSDELARGRDPFRRYGIDALVLVSPFYRRDPECFEYGVVGELLDNFRSTMDEGIRVMAGPRLDPSLRHDMARRVCERVGPYGYLSFFRSYLRTPWLRTDLITVPTLVISGEGDAIARSAESMALTADLPHARCRLIAGAGHFPMVEQVDAFSAALGEFAGSISGPNQQSPTKPLDLRGA